MSNSISYLENHLCKYFGRKHCILTGRCTSAIYISLKALDLNKGKVALPTIVNPSPANAILYAGLEPVFCDINLSDYTIDTVSLEQLIKREHNLKAIIAVHIFGQPADMDKILKIAKTNGLPVIEDAAQALGGKYRGKVVGSFGDISVVSFAHTKIIDAGLGGAVLTDNDAFASRLKEEVQKLPEVPVQLNELFEDYRRAYYTLKSLTEKSPRLNVLFKQIPYIFKDMYLFQINEEISEKILKEIGNLERNVAIRKENASYYQRRLTHPVITHPIYNEEGVFWRYSFLLKGDLQKRVSEKMRQEGFDISNWYPPLHHWYESGQLQDRNLFKNADYFAAHVCNLWTEPSQSKERIRDTINALLKIINDGNLNE
ncbi:MAG: DegT/DnrJ/EryC1/StrS family aminotransferase [Candidatus Methanoperedens sp.]|nr:DegT/DnrJ/EryC1/StrS family aminotransferase [Candidatus Methanoperedens sp.]CAG0969846.1 perosamine synthetase [Methanosarcinales archaeon]